MKFLKRINWLNTIFLILTPVVGIAGTVLLIVFGLLHWPTWVLAGVFTIVSGLCVTAGYHRLFAHKAYQAHWITRFIFILLGSSTFEGSVIEWCTDHRNHHRYTDTDRDPYNIKAGFWYAHIGWLFMLDSDKRDFNNVEDLMEDPLIRFQHKHFKWLSLGTGFGLPTAIAALWGDALGGFIVAGVLRVFVNHHLTFCINSVCHWFGKRTYSKRQSARDLWITALFTYGEGFHNFHHQFPLDYRNGIRAYHFDPTKWLIRGLSYVRLASDLKRVSNDRIQHYKMQANSQQNVITDQITKSLLDQLDTLKSPSMDPESI